MKKLALCVVFFAVSLDAFCHVGMLRSSTTATPTIRLIPSRLRMAKVSQDHDGENKRELIFVSDVFKVGHMAVYLAINLLLWNKIDSIARVEYLNKNINDSFEVLDKNINDKFEALDKNIINYNINADWLE